LKRHLEVSPLSGSGDHIISVVATSENPSHSSARTGTLVVTTEGGIEQEVSVIQDFATDVLDRINARMTIYPNPATSEIHVELGEVVPDLLVRIIDSSGSLLIEKKHQSERTFYIGTGELSSGTYTLEILCAYGRCSRTFVKM